MAVSDETASETIFGDLIPEIVWMPPNGTMCSVAKWVDILARIDSGLYLLTIGGRIPIATTTPLCTTF